MSNINTFTNSNSNSNSKVEAKSESCLAQQQQQQQQQQHQQQQQQDEIPLKTLVNTLQATIMSLQSTIANLNTRLECFERSKAKSAEREIEKEAKFAKKEAELMDIIKTIYTICNSFQFKTFSHVTSISMKLHI